ncbi:nucleotidyltransferase [Myxococcota bacterium]|nr:nucleotidyltransferase [Myxococcota bacterium]
MNITTRLSSALSDLYRKFSNYPEKLHLAVAVVFSSIFNENGIKTIIVGGQAVSLILRTSESRDVDFITSNTTKLQEILTNIGFEQDSFRYRHNKYNVLIEIVGEEVNIAGIKGDDESLAVISSDDIEDELVRKLINTDIITINPSLLFLNYVDASIPYTYWYNEEDNGKLALERARAIYELYNNYGIDSYIRNLIAQNKLKPDLVKFLSEEFDIN